MGCRDRWPAGAELALSLDLWLVERMRALITVGLLLALGGCADSFNLGKCDTAIKATLKTPASYKRVSTEGSAGSYWIEYDAVNLFNAPVRGAGRCTIVAGEASWSAQTPRE